MARTSKATQIALYIPAVDGERYSEFRTLSPYFVVIDEKQEVRNIYGWGDGEELADARFHCQWEKDKPALEAYGWRLEYHSVTVSSAYKATAILKVMRKVEAMRRKYPVSPTTFGQFVTLIAAGLGVKLAVIPKGSIRHSYDEREHRFIPVGEDTQRAIDGLMLESWEADHPERLALPA